ncbi:MAG TPA: aldehyde dehydrogenase family protein [Actinophytocola sp.]|uniref:aldehyde dehydrogenase family protein n=1 Tax=Actinophytocola sp. TaxID=1872138 RepID=UPI002DBAC6A7|nr:aldehyde dehydrogenase family protein [Actinophytocola sp.]HEU5469378.1 aldehyde dehydrogenase family protein [Actinophytocola sp.]
MYPMYLDGEPVETAETFASYEPATGAEFARLARAGEAEVDRAVDAARRAFDAGPWPRMSAAERADVLDRVAARLAADADRLADLEVRDSGATIRRATAADLPGTRAAFEWSAWWARGLADTEPAGGPAGPPAPGEYLRWHPVGVVATFVPWNFPLLLAAWRIAPAIAAGNTCVVKPASFTSVTACELVRILHEAGLPPGVVNLVLGPGAVVGDALTRDPRVDMSSFTGSNEVGEQVLAAAAGTGQRVRLDLGGKSANLVLADADLDRAVAGALWGGLLHNGQICMAGSRVLVHRDRHAEFLDRFRERAGKLVLGDPASAQTDLGPLVSRQQVRTVARYVKLGVEQGATVVCGGTRPDAAELPPELDAKAYFRPTALADVRCDNVVFREEIFGPVVAVTPFDSDEHAVALANNSRYHLAGAVWSTDPERAWRVADRLRADKVWVNDYRMVDDARPDPAAPPSAADRVRNELDEYRTVRRVHVAPPGYDNPLHPVLGIR